MSAAEASAAAVDKTEANSGTAVPKKYGFSVLISAVGKFFKSFGPLAIVIVTNAIVQAILISFGVAVGFSIGFLLLAVLSLVVLLWAFLTFNLVGLNSADGKSTIQELVAQGKAHWSKFVLWTLAFYVVVLLGLMFFPYAAIVFILIFPFVTLAAADGKSNPLKTNFQVIKKHWFRYLVTAIIFLIILLVSLLITAVVGFFVGGALGSVITWLYWGVFAAWYIIALALIYRSTPAGVTQES